MGANPVGAPRPGAARAAHGAAFRTLFDMADPMDGLARSFEGPGNGGGFGYGIMGATHHALEDVGALRALPNLKIYIPLVAADVPSVVARMASDPAPNYLRLNAPAVIPGEIPAFGAWRKLKSGRSAVVIGMGPVLQELYQLGAPELLDELEIWSAGIFPLDEIPAELCASIREKGRVVCIEEHYRACGLAEALGYALLVAGVLPASFTSLHAAGYPSGRYGSQGFHQRESGLAGAGLSSQLRKALRG